MAESATAERRSLSDVMLAMDVVDTLRHRRLLVEKELNADQRQQKLLDRLREIYASQGIAVSDEVLQAGVDALREERFSYRPPPLSLSVRLGRIYVTRDKWGRWAGAAVFVLLLAWLAYGWLVSGPAERRLAADVAALNAEVGATSERVLILEQEAGRIEATLADYTTGVPATYLPVAERKLAAARAELRHTGGLIEQAKRLDQAPDLSPRQFEDRAPRMRERLRTQQQLIATLDGHLETARASLTDIDSLKIFPAQLTQLLEAVNGAAQEQRARAMAQRLYAAGMGALRAGEIAEAETVLHELRALNTSLLQTYTLRIVSREGEQSGVWRIPERNPDARNYYLIVEAVAGDGRILSLNQTSEESGQSVLVDKWGLRVDERVYQRVRADKTDDGIIQGRRIGEKRRGKLEPDYLIETSGAVITQW